MLRLLYRILWGFAAPIAILRLLWRSRHDRGYAQHIGERFGYVRRSRIDASTPLIWVHAVSIGETRAAQPLIEALMATWPNARLLITSMTPIGRVTSKALFGKRVRYCYLPYDMRHTVKRFLIRCQPMLGVIMETEVWPTLINECRRARVPLVLANARMSERSYRRYGRAMKFGLMARDTFAAFSAVLAQSAADAERLTALGAHAVEVLGNLKFDVTPSPTLIAQGRAWRAAIGNRPIWIAASTRDGEEAQVLDAFKHSQLNNALLILVPRHPQRFNEVALLLERNGWRFIRRTQCTQWALPSAKNEARLKNDVNAAHSKNAKLATDVQVLLGDSMGEMAAYYAAADLALVGGSLLPFGGQNLIEACALGVPVLVGPHTFNFTQATADAIAAGAALRVVDSVSLGDALHTLLTDTHRRLAMGKAAAAFAARHSGATQRTIHALVGMVASSKNLTKNLTKKRDG